MLQLKNIKKFYESGDTQVTALAGVSIDFRESEFVSILGPSGCGKTTLLNIVGGLDRYSDGDLFINGRSTKEYRGLGGSVMTAVNLHRWFALEPIKHKRAT